MWKFRSSSEKGFSLIESMIALAVLAISLLGLSQLMSVALRQNAFGRSNTMAVSLAQEQLEQLRTEFNREVATGMPSSNLVTGSYGPVLVTFSPPAGSTTGAYQYNLSWSVTTSGKQKTVAVTVDPVQQDELSSKTLTITAIFAP